jgi:hypothetical protein
VIYTYADLFGLKCTAICTLPWRERVSLGFSPKLLVAQLTHVCLKFSNSILNCFQNPEDIISGTLKSSATLHEVCIQW